MTDGEEHTKNARESTRAKHEKGRSRRMTDAGGEKPLGWKRKWPPKKGPKKSR
jgi:hypothetical protein